MATALFRRPPARGRRCVPALSAVCVLALGACGTGAQQGLDDTVPASRTAPATSAPATAGADDGSVATTRLPVYWVGDADGEELLYREFRDAAEGAPAVDPIAAAAALMTAATPDDPDYRTLWSPVEQVGSSTSPDGTITVDLPSEAFRSDLDDREIDLALQQLAHTVTDAADTAGLLPRGTEAEVEVLVDGRADEEVFGSVRLDGPLRADERAQAPVWLIEPQHGTWAEKALTVSGRAADGVRDLRWTVAEEDGTTVASGAATVDPRDDGSTVFRAEAALEAGKYVVTVVGRDAEGSTVRDDKVVEVLPR